MDRYSRNFPTISRDGQKTLASCRVLAEGGCALAAELLVRAGIQTVHVLSNSGLVQRLREICSFGDFRTLDIKDIIPESYDIALVLEGSSLESAAFQKVVTVQSGTDPTSDMAQSALAAATALHVILKIS